MKKKVLVLFILIILLSFVFAQEANETQTPLTITCYSSKDCPQPPTNRWCDNQNACQELAICSNPGTPESACSVAKECVNCADMGYLGCSNGECRNIRCSQDSECGEPITKRYCSGSRLCVYEFVPYCQNPGTIDSSCTNKAGESCNYCQYGCTNTACNEALQQAICTDSDGGDYYTQGKTCSASSCETDNCVGNTVIEYGCIENRVGVIFTYGCEKCENGACVTATTSVEGCVQKGSTCCKGEGCVGIACPVGETATFKGCDARCMPIGSCYSGEQVSEQVKCVFKNSKEMQKCYLAEYNDKFFCSGKETCVIDIKGYKGEKFTWKSSCGGYAYTFLDGYNEYAEFDCSQEEACQASLCKDGNYNKCYKDEKGYCVCSTCPEIIVKPVCGNGICESGEGQFCSTAPTTCEAGKECRARAECKLVCPEDCKPGIEGIYAKLNEKFKLQISQPVKITDYKEIKIMFRDLLTQKCEEAVTAQQEVKEKITGYAALTGFGGVEEETVEIMKCPAIGPMAQLEIVNPERMPDEGGKKILTLKLNEFKNVYDVSVGFMEYDYASRTGVFLVKGEKVACPENCKCDDKGYALECKEEEKCEEDKLLCPDGVCREECSAGNSSDECKYGCFYGDKCLPIGVRVKGMYCGVDGTMNSELIGEESCENNFECESNVCVAGKCISSSFIQKIINWFKRLFGRD